MSTPFSRKIVENIIEKYRIVVEDTIYKGSSFSPQTIKIDNVTCTPPQIVYLPGFNGYTHYPGQKMEFDLWLTRETVVAFLSDDQRTLNIAINLGDTLVKQVKDVTWVQIFKVHPLIVFDDFNIRLNLNHYRTHPFEDITHHTSGTYMVLHIRMFEDSQDDIDRITSLSGEFVTREKERFWENRPILGNVRR